MKDSIIVNMRYANYDLIDGRPDVHRHHVFMGAKQRDLADEDGLWIPLSEQHHEYGLRPDTGVRCDVHHCKIFRQLTQIIGQLAWELEYVADDQKKKEAREAFRKRYGQSML